MKNLKCLIAGHHPWIGLEADEDFTNHEDGTATLTYDMHLVVGKCKRCGFEGDPDPRTVTKIWEIGIPTVDVQTSVKNSISSHPVRPHRSAWDAE